MAEQSQIRSGVTMSSATGKGRSHDGSKQIEHGFYKVKGKAHHAMEDYHVAEFRRVGKHELGLYAIYDGHKGHSVPEYPGKNLFDNILNERDFWRDPRSAIMRAYHSTDRTILKKGPVLGSGGSTAVTAILVDGSPLLVANVGDSRAVLCQAGQAIQLSVDHEPSIPSERCQVESKGGFVSQFPGDVPRVDGQLAVARGFGDKSLKDHLSADPDMKGVAIDSQVDFLILASDGLWKVMKNEEAVECVRSITDPQFAAKALADEALARRSTDDISCIVVRF
ncbi:hypothetical protein O6H91_14G009900 [Diphasiastrum complanatum]|uniref:Uncharacterized protein n=1 Tax=Diphasiastrum complanatum TaxID=34168 RepID=A0ACC2BLG5_DIPCM|nr:hypothetical protein O6H91_14G009900 [Diphasiastrum complanatum]